MSGLHKAIKLAGSQDALAQLLTNYTKSTKPIKQGHVSYWLKNSLPASRALQIEAALDGQVTREELCPEIFSVPRPEAANA